jgi:hypothetical protein
MNARLRHTGKAQRKDKKFSFSYTPEDQIKEFLVKQKRETGAAYKWQLDQAMRMLMATTEDVA